MFNDWWATIILALVQTVLAAIITHSIKKRIDAKAELEHTREATRQKRDELLLHITMADADLSYAVVAAIKRGSPNGEIEKAVEKYKKAMEAYTDFMQSQAIAKLREDK